MCISCGDWIDSCSQDECHTPTGTPYGNYRQFYLDSPYCRHKAAEYGHPRARWEDRYGPDDDD